ncbi:DUF6670 family protein [Kibdelosporangium phytohabitans]|uniref:AttH domain-containing protein n=1 Tax=Kibdelosporangium phytohabitans TaxID=860235 RepID=A0A0N9I2F8_9PSEU|nr:DUF6670 family protein [Kibdelosporangium phytohabitans]ALG11861.1 hypothetical protein AOZ06_37780 [Kibdelosporangium phytohabitans]MBE1463291.1 hypothetical protein [Kibdelosporangium phytohabitans]
MSERTPPPATAPVREHPGRFRASRFKANLWRKAIPHLFGAHRDDKPLPRPAIFPPRGRGWGISHYNVVIPELPAPHLFLGCTTMQGASGFQCHDNDFAVRDSPRKTATLALGTAASTHESFTTYSIPLECELAPDGSVLRWGADLLITGLYPEFRLHSRRPGFALDLDIVATGEHSNYARSYLYTHLGMLARYTGMITQDGEITPIAGLCSLEYATGRTPHVLRDRPLPLKLPIDFFTWHVINLDADTQLQFVQMSAQGGYEVVSSAWLREAGKGSTRYGGVDFKVLTYQADPQVAPDGRETYLPETFQALIPGAHGRQLFELTATLDTQVHYGLGRGYLGGYHYQGTRSGKPIAGRGYIEFIEASATQSERYRYVGL